MDLVRLFGSKERMKILEHAMLRENLRVTTIARELGLSKGLVSGYLGLLQDSGLVQETMKGNLSPTDNPAARQIKRLLNMVRIYPRRLNKKGILGMGIYGSWAEGTNTIDSDADIWLKVKEYPSQEYLAVLSAELRKMLGCEIRLLVLTPSKTREVTKDGVFFSSLRSHSILLWGEDID